LRDRELLYGIVKVLSSALVVGCRDNELHRG
jgi:hypothetical protein